MNTKTNAAPAGKGNESGAKNVPTPTDILYGSDNFESNIVLIEGGATVALGDVVQKAHTDSKLSVKDWNELDQKNRDGFIQSAVGELTTEAVAADVQRAQEEADALAAANAQHDDQEVVTFNDQPGAGKEVSVNGETYKANKSGEFKMPLAAAKVLEESHGFKRKL